MENNDEKTANEMSDGAVKNVSEQDHEGTPSEESPPSIKSNFTSNIPEGLTLIDETGTCVSCNDLNAQEKSVSCFLCKNSFHAVCREENGTLVNKLCNRTFLDHYSKRLDRKDCFDGSFCFICDLCLTDFEEKRAGNLQSHVHSLENRMRSMEANLTDIKNLLKAQCNTGNTPPPADDMSPSTEQTTELVNASSNPWNDKARMQLVKSRVAMVVEKSDLGDSIAKDTLKKIVLDNNILIEETYDNKKGDKIIVLASQEDRTKLSEKLTADHPEHSLRQPHERLPVISMANIEEEISPDDLKGILTQMHTEIIDMMEKGDVFDVLRVRKQRKGTNYQACIRVSENIRKFIEVALGNYLHMGMYRCAVYDHLYVKRCNKCQRYGHYEKYCKASATCAKCAGGHDTKECTAYNKDGFKPTCTNCKKTSTTFGFTHTASSSQCFSYLAAQNKLRQ